MEDKFNSFYKMLSENLIPLTKKRGNLIPIYILESEDELPTSIKKTEITYLRAIGFFSLKADTAFLSDEKGNISCIFIRPKFNDVRFSIGERIARLPDGDYEIKTKLSKGNAFETILGFCLSAYRFQNYKKERTGFGVRIYVPRTLDYKKVCTFVWSEYFTRNLINTPASDLAPENLEKVVESFSKEREGKFSTILGEELLTKNFPLIHSVGRAGSESPRLVRFTWGNPESFKVTLVGKGVCFDTGGLNIKPDSAMSIMKKDMGGAASVLGLANCIIGLRLKVYLTVIIPIVENSISSKSFRPGDILVSRKGLSVEVNNTDAEGRLILADALAFADESSPDILISLATLTGAARIGLGPDIVPFYTSNERFSKLLEEGSLINLDPVWRLPLHREYEHLIEPEMADLDNAPKTGMAGSITAALFLNRFVEKSGIFAHFDIYSWCANARPGRQLGGIMQAVRAICYALEKRI